MQRLIVIGDTKRVAIDSKIKDRVQKQRTGFIHTALKVHLIDFMPEEEGGKIVGDDCNWYWTPIFAQ